MNIAVAVLVWVTVNGFPMEPFETCELAQTRAEELKQQMPDLEVRAECEISQLDNGGNIDYYGHRIIPKGGDSVRRSD